MKDARLTTAQKLYPPAETVIREFRVKWEQIHPFYNGLIVNIPTVTAVTDTDLAASVSDSPDHLHGAGTQR